jgi:hypothetical protein
MAVREIIEECLFPLLCEGRRSFSPAALTISVAHRALVIG